MAENLPLLVILLDYLLGSIMWTLVGRAGMNIFMPINSSFFFMRMFVLLTNPFIRLFKPITPVFLVEPLVPLYVAWFFFLFRFYIMPWLLGYSVIGMLAFPLESEVSLFLYQMFN